MNNTLGKTIGELRRSKNMTQDRLAEQMDISGQAGSKWENDISCPDVLALPKLAKILGVSVDALLGVEEPRPDTQLLPIGERKDPHKMLLKINVDSSNGDKVRVNLPVALLKVALDIGIQLPQMSGSEALKSIDFAQIIALIDAGVIGKLIEVESADGDSVYISVE
jgi:transcriptional regulator with XRE-family HTH domain